MPLLDSALAAHGVALGHASLIAIDDRVPAAELLRHVWRFAAIESCGTCAPCRIGSGRGAGLAERVVAGDASALAEQQPLLTTMETASMCAFGRGVPPRYAACCGSTPTSCRHEGHRRRARS